MSYASEYRRSLADPEGFWRERAAELPWLEFPPTVLDRDGKGAWRWYHGGLTNTCWLALDRHVEEGRGDAVALITTRRSLGRSPVSLAPNCSAAPRGLPAASPRLASPRATG